MARILVFDSGIGGLTVMQELQRVAPNHNYVYLADTKHCPYGTKSNAFLQNRIKQIVQYYCNVDAIVVACNTMSCVILQNNMQFTQRVFDVVTPTCNYLCTSNFRSICLLATKFTMESKIYSQILDCSGKTVKQYNCSSLVPFIEQNTTNSIACLQQISNIFANKKHQNKSFDAVLLACTHFPILKPHLQYYFPNVPMLDCSTYTAQSVLEVMGNGSQNGTVQYLTTGNVCWVNRACKKFGVQFCHVEI